MKPTAAIPALRHPNQEMDDTAYTLNAFARGWAAGVDVDLDRFAGEGRRVVRLPGYAFRKERHWIEPGGTAISTGFRTGLGGSRRRAGRHRGNRGAGTCQDRRAGRRVLGAVVDRTRGGALPRGAGRTVGRRR